MTYEILNKSNITLCVVKYILDNGSVVDITVPVFDAQSEEDINIQLTYRGNLLNNGH